MRVPVQRILERRFEAVPLGRVSGSRLSGSSASSWSRAARGYDPIGLIIPLRPSVVPTSAPRSRSATSVRSVASRFSLDLEVFPTNRASRIIRSGCVLLRDCSSFRVLHLFKATDQRRGGLSSGFVPFDGSGSERFAFGCHASRLGTHRVSRPSRRLSSAPSLPGLFRPGPPLGFSPSGPVPSVDRSSLSALACLRGVDVGVVNVPNASPSRP